MSVSLVGIQYKFNPEEIALKNQLHLVYSCKENPQGIRYCERILKIERNETTAIYKILGYCVFLWFFFKKMSKTVTLVTISSQF